VQALMLPGEWPGVRTMTTSSSSQSLTTAVPSRVKNGKDASRSLSSFEDRLSRNNTLTDSKVASQPNCVGPNLPTKNVLQLG
jgi:hypothetical protein